MNVLSCTTVQSDCGDSSGSFFGSISTLDTTTVLALFAQAEIMDTGVLRFPAYVFRRRNYISLTLILLSQLPAVGPLHRRLLLES
jgi:hypothetical protein